MMSRLLVLALLLFAVVTPLGADEPVPMEDCAMCHDDVAEPFAAGPHGSLMAARSPKSLEISCATCHGATAAHVDEPDVSNVNRRPDNAACLRCHVDSMAKMDLATPGHVRNGIACLDCHASGHGESKAEHLLLDEPRLLCARCHQQEANTFRLPYAHRNGLKPFDCTECHEIHDVMRAGRISLLDAGAPCVSCHIEKKTPFVFPHPPGDRDGCVSCHVPHGTTNPRQLTRASVTMLCLECHPSVPSFHDITRPRYKNCQSCHAAIHGSNRDPLLFKE